jgi:hypothetical protein
VDSQRTVVRERDVGHRGVRRARRHHLRSRDAAEEQCQGEADREEKGDTGDTGTFGSITTKFFQATSDLANGTNASYGAFCPAGQVGVAGGGRGDDTLSEETIITNTRPAISSSNTEPPLAGQGFTGWRITVVNPTGGAASGIKPEVWVVCVTP